MGRNWLQRAQATLARIHREEGDSSSGGSGGQAGNSPYCNGNLEFVFDANYFEASLPADPRRQGPLYVEARGYLQPAVDFYARAVRSADALGTTTGDLLAAVRFDTTLVGKLLLTYLQAAESQMSLGNVTGTPGDERFFSQAIRYLRRAEAVPGYTLSVYLAQYLNEYGRYVS